jgi:hypothetical protein
LADAPSCDRIKPAAKRAGIGNIGWRPFRHTHASLLADLDTKPVVQKELLRHASISATMKVRTQGVPKSAWKATGRPLRLCCELLDELGLDGFACYGEVLWMLAGTTGLEPATSCVTGMRSNQLNYVPWKNGSSAH